MSLPSTASSTNNKASTNQWIRGIVFTALFGALFIAAGMIKIPIGFTPVPISLQSFAIMLAGGLLGAVYGFWSIFLVVILTATGLPLMNGSGGLSQILGPTGGFIWMFPVSAFLIGWVSDRLFANNRKLNRKQQIGLLLSIFALGSLLLYVSGIPWYAHVSTKVDLSGALAGAMYPFLPGDAIKAIAATLVITSIRPLLPSLRPNRSS
ncbi:biotin transporter BioY [Paenibacillus eucommiae]|uniref:Biotin transporter n=1 Tax=Paenibacillus eucommiae TaxID=1355755 RepID=A0ABS4IR08_9BACL|nr:biotin transporter BioY [Paenibacillus eucommiae]MBP1990002.1 biotin transport system substrate-specific component [Paenibacillus eucommiae]